jgi:hypothetical protein
MGARMNADDLDRFEQQTAELVGAAKALLKEFENRLGEAVSVQRLAASEAREEGAQFRKQMQTFGGHLEKLLELHKMLLGNQSTTLGRLEADWKQQFTTIAANAGAEQAKTFGSGIAAGLRAQLDASTQDVKRATYRFYWLSNLRWILGIAAAVPLTIALGIWAFFPSVEGLPMLHVRVAMSHLSICEIEKQAHVCIAVDDKPQTVSTPNHGPMVVVKGM